MTYPCLYILRHGETEWNAEHRVQGSLDSPLTERGRAQARMQHRILQSLDLTGFSALSSPQGRAFHTASIALAGLVDRIDTDARLREIAVGEWEGKTRDQILPGEQMDESADNAALMLYERAPNGEGFSRLRARCQSFLDDLTGPSVLVTHGITSRMLRLVLLDMDTCEIGALPGGQGVVFHLENGRQTKLAIGA
ncbi:MAG: histidine phosphatase family protein [Pseudomonadota bacterium]